MWGVRRARATLLLFEADNISSRVASLGKLSQLWFMLVSWDDRVAKGLMWGLGREGILGLIIGNDCV